MPPSPICDLCSSLDSPCPAYLICIRHWGHLPELTPSLPLPPSLPQEAVSLSVICSLSIPLDPYLSPGLHIPYSQRAEGNHPERVVVQSLSHVLTLCNPMACSMQASLSFTISRSLLKLISTESVVPSNHLIFCCPLLLLPSIFPSIRVFSNKSALFCIRWLKY